MWSKVNKQKNKDDGTADCGTIFFAVFQSDKGRILKNRKPSYFSLGISFSFNNIKGIIPNSLSQFNYHLFIPQATRLLNKKSM